jgi:hypothetical protein
MSSAAAGGSFGELASGASLVLGAALVDAELTSGDPGSIHPGPPIMAARATLL